MVRIKERYLLVNILQPPKLGDAKQTNVPDIIALHRPITENMNYRTLQKAIRTEVKSLFGNFGSGAVEVGFNVKYFSSATAAFILKVSRKYYRLAWAALTMMNTIPGSSTPCIYRVVRVSGTIHQAEEEAIKQARSLILAARDDTKSNATTNSLGFGGEDIMDADMSNVKE